MRLGCVVRRARGTDERTSVQKGPPVPVLFSKRCRISSRVIIQGVSRTIPETSQRLNSPRYRSSKQEQTPGTRLGLTLSCSTGLVMERRKRRGGVRAIRVVQGIVGSIAGGQGEDVTDGPDDPHGEPERNGTVPSGNGEGPRFSPYGFVILYTMSPTKRLNDSFSTNCL